MTFTPTVYGSFSSEYNSKATVAAFTPAANKVLYCAVIGANNSAPTSITGHGTWTLLADVTNSSNRRMLLYGILIGGSPSSSTVEVSYANSTRRAATVFGFDGIDESSLSATYRNIEATFGTGVTPRTVTATLPAFGDSTNNVVLVIADALSGSGDATTTPKAGYSTLSTTNYLDIYYDTGEDTSPNFVTNANYVSTSIIAMELVAASGSGPQTVTATGIATAEAFGSHTLTTGAASVSPGGIASLEAFGSHSLGGVSSVVASAIASLEAFGSLTFTSLVEIFPGSIASLETFGSPTFSTTFEIIAQAINSAEAFGSAIVAPGEVVLLPTGIPTAEAFGAAIASQGALILPLSIETLEAFGNPSLTTGVVTILPSSIGSGEAFGIATIGDVVIVGEAGLVASIVGDLIEDLIEDLIG